MYVIARAFWKHGVCHPRPPLSDLASVWRNISWVIVTFQHVREGVKVNGTTSQPSPVAGKVNVEPWDTVVACYSAIDRFFPACGLFDMTEGIYHGNPETPYERAEVDQLDYLLDQIQCGPGRRVLDLGCGYGTLLEQARKRKAAGVGITISPEQLKCCYCMNLDVHLLDYRAIPCGWDRTPARTGESSAESF